MVARGAVTLMVVVMVGVTLVERTEGVERGPANRATRMENLRRSNVDLKAVREKYMKAYEGVPCTPMEPSPEDPPLPEVPRSFMTQVEILIDTNSIKRVIHGAEMYDSPSRRGVNDYDLKAGQVGSHPSLTREEMHYNHDLDEALFILTKDPCIITGEEGCTPERHCTAGKIKDLNAELQEIFGIVDTSGGGEFMGAMGLMQFGPLFNYTFNGVEDCRGARCQVFQTCMNKPDEGDVNLLYTYYWTTDDWDVQNNGNSVPMILDIVDTTHNGFTLHIEFYNYKREWMPSLDELEAPVDVYCVNRVTYISQPKTISRCFYKSEQVGGINVNMPVGDGQTENVHLRAMFPQQEWYDYNMRISRTDYIPFFIFGADRRFENYTQEVLEFNQGLMYKVRPRLSTCRISPINYNITWGDVVVGEDGSIQMMNPWNWEDLNEPMQYNGLHWERGMSADVWVGVKPSPTLKLNETVVWYFASPFTDEILALDAPRDKPKIKLPTLDKVPIKLEKYLSAAEGVPHIVYHIYGFEGIIPLTHNHDVSLCFASHQMRHFTFDLPRNAIERSLFLRENLKYAIQGALHEAGSVSPLRINRLELTQTKEAVQVTFTLLEKPSKVADVGGDEGENTMDVAAAAIQALIDASQLIILVKYGNAPEESKKNIIVAKMTAHPHTMVEVIRSQGLPEGTEILTGYSSGDMTGLAIGMIILGLLMGFGGMYLYGSRK